jgi:hypothetical protein
LFVSHDQSLFYSCDQILTGLHLLNMWDEAQSCFMPTGMSSIMSFILDALVLLC